MLLLLTIALILIRGVLTSTDFLVLLHEQFCVLDEEIHVELVLRLLKFVWVQIQEHFIIVNDRVSLFVDNVKGFESCIRVELLLPAVRELRCVIIPLLSWVARLAQHAPVLVLILLQFAEEESVLAGHLLILRLFDLAEVLQEENSIFVAIVRPSEDVPSDSSCPTDLLLFIAIEDINLIVFVGDKIRNPLDLFGRVDALVGLGQAAGRLHELWDLLPCHKLVIRVEEYLHATLRSPLDVQELSLLIKLGECNQGRRAVHWGSFGISATI